MEQHTNTRRASRSDVVKLVALVAFIVMLGVIAVLIWPYLSFLGQKDGINLFVEKIQQAGAAGVGILLVVQLIQVIIALIPGEVVQMAAGIMYGPVFGALIIFVGCVISSAFIYLLVNRLGAPFVRDMIPQAWAEKMDVFEKSEKMDVTVFVLFLIPGLPKDLFTYIVPLTDMSPLRYLAISNIARIPGIVMSTTAASGLATGNLVTSIVMFAILALLAVLALVFNEKIFNALRAKKQRSGAKDSDDEASSPQE